MFGTTVGFTEINLNLLHHVTHCWYESVCCVTAEHFCKTLVLPVGTTTVFYYYDGRRWFVMTLGVRREGEVWQIVSYKDKTSPNC